MLSFQRRPASCLAPLHLEQIAATSWRITSPLYSHAVDWQVALNYLILVGSGTEGVIPTELGCVLNGTLVGLVSSWEDGASASDAAITESVTQSHLHGCLMFRVLDHLRLLLRRVFGSRSFFLFLILHYWQDWNFGSGFIGCRDARPYAGASLIPQVLTCVRDGAPRLGDT